MVGGKIELGELDDFWYGKLNDALPSGELRSIGSLPSAS